MLFTHQTCMRGYSQPETAGRRKQHITRLAYKKHSHTHGLHVSSSTIFVTLVVLSPVLASSSSVSTSNWCLSSPNSYFIIHHTRKKTDREREREHREYYPLLSLLISILIHRLFIHSIHPLLLLHPHPLATPSLLNHQNLTRYFN